MFSGRCLAGPDLWFVGTKKEESESGDGVGKTCLPFTQDPKQKDNNTGPVSSSSCLVSVSYITLAFFIEFFFCFGCASESQKLCHNFQVNAAAAATWPIGEELLGGECVWGVVPGGRPSNWWLHTAQFFLPLPHVRGLLTCSFSTGADLQLAPFIDLQLSSAHVGGSGMAPPTGGDVGTGAAQKFWSP